MEQKKFSRPIVNMERDPDYINQMLWKRKKLKKRRERNEQKKARKSYFKQIESGPLEQEVQVEDKHKQFYSQLFSKSDDSKQIKKKKKNKNKNKSLPNQEEIKQEEPLIESEQNQSKQKKQTFNQELDRIKNRRELEIEKREQMKKEREKKFKQKNKYAKKLNQKTKNGQPVMKNLIAHYLNKIEQNK